VDFVVQLVSTVDKILTGIARRAVRPSAVEQSLSVPILSVFPALIVHSELKSVQPGFPVAFNFSAQVN